MAIVQEALYIPDEIMRKLITGEYRRIGGIVRYAIGPKKGQIVNLLDSVDFKVAQQPQGIVAKVLRFTKNNKKVLIIGGVIVGVVAAGGFIYYKVKTYEQKIDKQFQEELQNYIDEIRNGNLELDTINSLIFVLDELKNRKDYEQFMITLSTGEFETFVNLIHDYIIRFAEINKVEITEELIHTNSSILNLQNYLNIQKHIFEDDLKEKTAG